MEEHPLFEQGDACPAIRLPLQQFEAIMLPSWLFGSKPCVFSSPILT